MKLLDDFEHRFVENFDINQNGIQIWEDATRTIIYNDPFSTIPLFITQSSDAELIVFSNFENFYTLDCVDKTIDDVGFWEIVLFGSGLWTRTLYKSVQQMPGASKIVIDKLANTYTIERYWDYNIEVDNSIDSMDKAVDGLYDKMDKIFSEFDKSSRYVMGLSGGLDSRITLAFLSRHIPKDHLELFTYGFDDRIYEYCFAKEIAGALGFNQPTFHSLTIDSYIKAEAYLPVKSGGQISMNHSHITDYLKHTQSAVGGKFQISNYYTDALFGYACDAEKKYNATKDEGFRRIIDCSVLKDEGIKHEILKDVENVLSSYDSRYNFCSVDEYKYVSERNQKFHMLLASIQGKFLPTILPYTNIDLFQYMMSVPIKFRANKGIVDHLISKYFKNISSEGCETISSRALTKNSSTFLSGSRYSDQLDVFHFKLLNRINALLRLTSSGRFQLLNKYQTEEQERLLFRDFKNKLHGATSLMCQKGLFTAEQKKHYDHLSIKSGACTSERYTLLSLAHLV